MCVGMIRNIKGMLNGNMDINGNHIINEYVKAAMDLSSVKYLFNL